MKAGDEVSDRQPGYHAGGFLTCAHGGEPPDFVYTRHAVHRIPDFRKAITRNRIGRILRRGGALRLLGPIFSCSRAEAEEAFEA